jgi:hypothetical protein
MTKQLCTLCARPITKKDIKDGEIYNIGITYVYNGLLDRHYGRTAVCGYCVDKICGFIDGLEKGE